MSRWQASSLHLAISILVMLTLGLILASTWYPPVYARSVGGLDLIGILAGVDACLGPLLTLVVWNVKKPSLKFDLAVIVMFQLAGLSYGMYTIFLARPVYMVFATDRFELVRAVDIPTEELAKVTRDEFKSLPLTGPRTVAAKRPDEVGERMRILSSALTGGADLANLPQHYLPYADRAADAASKGMPIAKLMERDAETRHRLAASMESGALQPAKLKYLPLQAKKRDQTVLIDAITGEIRQIVDVDPWLRK